jgi:hypothetical protein
MLTHVLNHNLMQTMAFWVLFHLSTRCFKKNIIHISWFQGQRYYLTIHRMFLHFVLLQQKRGILRSKYPRKQQRNQIPKTRSFEHKFVANS